MNRSVSHLSRLIRLTNMPHTPWPQPHTSSHSSFICRSRLLLHPPALNKRNRTFERHANHVRIHFKQTHLHQVTDTTVHSHWTSTKTYSRKSFLNSRANLIRRKTHTVYSLVRLPARWTQQQEERRNAIISCSASFRPTNPRSLCTMLTKPYQSTESNQSQNAIHTKKRKEEQHWNRKEHINRNKDMPKLAFPTVVQNPPSRTQIVPVV